ncbi:ABC transporter substrate-binding protein [Devosia sp. A16]|uniref:ABC transporter substrate-binding protein n=1 Tax=Devosia sp. A16 TaxID=1736675 RepID=UPI0006D83476|nr:ABC transporter substrate-binding protein [Devosia sp. A16]
MRLRFKLNHYYQGQNAPFLYAADAGLLADAGIEMDFIEGFSSSQVTRAIVEGGADIGFGDVTSVIQHAMTNGDTSIRCLLPIYARSPCALGYHHSVPPLALSDLGGARLCGPQGDTSARLLPALLALNGLADLHYDFVTVTPEERDRMVANHEVLAATCFDATLKFAMPMRGHDSSDIEFLYFADHGLDSYSSAVIYDRAKIGETSAALAAVFRQAWQDCRQAPELGVAAVTARNPLLEPALVRAQLQWVLDHQVFLSDRPALVFEPATPRWSNTVAIARYGVTGKFQPHPADTTIGIYVCDL